MKIRLSLPEEKKAPVGEKLIRHGIKTCEDAEYTLIETPRSGNFLNVRDKEGGALRLSADQIVYIEAFGKDIEVHTLQDTYYSQDRIYRLEELLDPREFIRISKSVIIAKSSVKKIRPALTMKFVLTLSDDSLVDVTRSCYTNFRRFFNI
ncbi:MAG: LytTR family transcriptional regulator [Lachnospiraceae bacterium]|jgi:two-component system response regulator LytT|nr:LytTR family transcriptional regulator [Lachnospiraceae bacterium]